MKLVGNDSKNKLFVRERKGTYVFDAVSPALLPCQLACCCCSAAVATLLVCVCLPPSPLLFIQSVGRVLSLSTTRISTYSVRRDLHRPK